MTSAVLAQMVERMLKQLLKQPGDKVIHHLWSLWRQLWILTRVPDPRIDALVQITFFHSHAKMFIWPVKKNWLCLFVLISWILLNTTTLKAPKLTNAQFAFLVWIDAFKCEPSSQWYYCPLCHLWRTKSAKIIQNFQNYENQINKYMNKLQFIFTI